VLRDVPLQVQNLAVPLVEPHEVPEVSPFLQIVEVSQDGSMAFWCSSLASQFCVLSTPVGSTICPKTWIILYFCLFTNLNICTIFRTFSNCNLNFDVQSSV